MDTDQNKRFLTTEQLDEIQTIHCCLRAVSDLMIPEKDLHLVGRDELAMLLGYLLGRLQKATEGAA